MEIVLAVCLGSLLDLLLGDPVWMPHPVVAIGKLISASEAFLRRRLPETKAGLRAGGVLLVLIVLLTTGALSFGLLFLARMLHPALGFLLQVFWSYQALAARCLSNEAGKVRQALESGSLSRARQAVSGLVGRDTQALDDAGVARATVETVAENTSDGVVAPLFYLMIGGAGLGLLYKAVNTMDSMVGYTNDRYRYFGTAAARLDDVCNYLPARLSGLLFVAAAAITGLDAKNAFKIWRRDRRNHKSPNSAQTESACAGALGIQLGGDASYFGVLHKKPTIGDPLHPITPADITLSCRLMYGSSALALLLTSGARLFLLSLLR